MSDPTTSDKTSGNTPGAFDEHPRKRNSKLGKVKLFNAFPQALINEKAASMIDPVSRAAAEATVSRKEIEASQRNRLHKKVFPK